MSWKITVSGVPDNKLATVLRALPKLDSVQIQEVQNGEAKGDTQKRRKRAPPTTKLTMTGKVGHSEILQKGLEAFEKLEAKNGVGDISIEDFRAELKRKKMPATLCRRMVRDGFLGYLD